MKTYENMVKVRVNKNKKDESSCEKTKAIV